MIFFTLNTGPTAQERHEHESRKTRRAPQDWAKSSARWARDGLHAHAIQTMRLVDAGAARHGRQSHASPRRLLWTTREGNQPLIADRNRRRCQPSSEHVGGASLLHVVPIGEPTDDVESMFTVHESFAGPALIYLSRGARLGKI